MASHLRLSLLSRFGGIEAVDAEFPYRVPIVDRGAIAGPLFSDPISDSLGDRFLSSAGAGGSCARPTRLPDPSPVLDKNRVPTGPEFLSSTGAGVWRKAPMAFPNSSSVLDQFQSAILRHTF